VLKAYEYRDNWVNRMILGDSLVVMKRFPDAAGPSTFEEYDGVACGDSFLVVSLRDPGRANHGTIS